MSNSQLRGFESPPRSTAEKHEHIAGWNRHIDKILTDWLPNLQDLSDEEFTAPSLAVVEAAVKIAERFRANGDVPPDRVLMDGDGGITFRSREGDVILKIMIYEEDDVGRVKAVYIELAPDRVVCQQEIEVPGL